MLLNNCQDQCNECNGCDSLCKCKSEPLEVCEEVTYCTEGCDNPISSDCIVFPDGSNLTQQFNDLFIKLDTLNVVVNHITNIISNCCHSNDCVLTLDVNETSTLLTAITDSNNCTPEYTWTKYTETGAATIISTTDSTPINSRDYLRLDVVCGDCSETWTRCSYLMDNPRLLVLFEHTENVVSVQLAYEGIGNISYSYDNMNFMSGGVIPIDMLTYRRLRVYLRITDTPCGDFNIDLCCFANCQPENPMDVSVILIESDGKCETEFRTALCADS